MNVLSMLVIPAAAESGSAGDWLAHIGVPTGIASAIAIIVVTLIKARSSDRQQLSSDQQRYIARVTKERNEAIRDREKLQHELDLERVARRKAEDEQATANRNVAALQDQIAELTQEVSELRTEVSRLTARLNNNQGEPI